MQYAKWREKAWEFQHVICGPTIKNVVMPSLNSQVIYQTNLTFCASYKDGTRLACN